VPGAQGRLGSLNARIITTAGLLLVVFLGTAGLAIEHVFRDTTLASLQDALKARIFIARL